MNISGYNLLKGGVRVKCKTKIGVLFSGGPAPSANSVISSVALNFIDNGIEVTGFLQGFEFLQKYDEKTFLMEEGKHYINIGQNISAIRNRGGVYLKTSRANPGKDIATLEDLKDPVKNRKLMNIVEALSSMGIGILITIGGDDTLKTANFLNHLGLTVIHIPKTIDNDYYGIPWTFGYWSAVQTSKELLLNLKADAESTNSYFIAELMGRKAGWLTYAAGIAGETVMMLSSEDFEDKDVVDPSEIAERVVDLIMSRERAGKHYGVVAVAEGLADKLPEKLRSKEVDKHGNEIYGAAKIGDLIRQRVEKAFIRRTGRKKKVVYKQIGYETRTARPVSFDVVMGSMLGYGAWALFKKGIGGVMVSVSDNFSVIGIPFGDLIDKDSLKTRLRNVPVGSDFYNLKEALSFMK